MSLLLRAIISPARPERAETRSDPASTAKQHSFDPEPFSYGLGDGINPISAPGVRGARAQET